MDTSTNIAPWQHLSPGELAAVDSLLDAMQWTSCTPPPPAAQLPPPPAPPPACTDDMSSYWIPECLRAFAGSHQCWTLMGGQSTGMAKAAVTLSAAGKLVKAQWSKQADAVHYTLQGAHALMCEWRAAGHDVLLGVNLLRAPPGLVVLDVDIDADVRPDELATSTRVMLDTLDMRYSWHGDASLTKPLGRHYYLHIAAPDHWHGYQHAICGGALIELFCSGKRGRLIRCSGVQIPATGYHGSTQAPPDEWPQGLPTPQAPQAPQAAAAPGQRRSARRTTGTDRLPTPDEWMRWAQQQHGWRKAGAGEWCGPCPVCGGQDRCRVNRTGIHCRQCDLRPHVARLADELLAPV